MLSFFMIQMADLKRKKTACNEMLQQQLVSGGQIHAFFSVSSQAVGHGMTSYHTKWTFPSHLCRHCRFLMLPTLTKNPVFTSAPLLFYQLTKKSEFEAEAGRHLAFLTFELG